MAMKCTSLRGRFQTTFTRRGSGRQVVLKCVLFVNDHTIENINAGGLTQVVKKSQILVNVVYERPLSLHSLQNNDTQYVSSTHKTLVILILSLLLSGNLRRFFLVFNSSKKPQIFSPFSALVSKKWSNQKNILLRQNRLAQF